MESIIGDLARLALPLSPIPPSGLPCSGSIRTLTISSVVWVGLPTTRSCGQLPVSAVPSDSLGGDNRSGYNNPEFDAKVDEARTIVDDEERVVAKMPGGRYNGRCRLPRSSRWMFYTHTIVGSDRIKHLYVDRRSMPSWVPLSSPKSLQLP